MADHVIGFITGGISRGIAITSEALAGEKGRSSAEARAQNRRGSAESESDEDITQQIWELDEAANDTGAIPEKSTVACSLCQLEHSTTNPEIITSMEQSVVIPQRRPGTRARGFVQAYAPVLGENKGIDQETFLEFLRDLDKSSKSSPVFDVINLACFGVGMIPDATCFAVSTAVGTASQIAQELQIRYKTNSCLDEMNIKLFQPHGSFAMIMTYKPDMEDEPVLTVDTNQMDVAVFKSLNNSKAKELFRRLRKSSGKTPESQIPDCAPLIYPSLDLVLSSNELTKQSSAKAKAVNAYLDQRAQTVFQTKNPNSKLTQIAPPQEKPYVNRFADPNHPVNSGSIFGLLTGGAFDPIAAGRVQRAERHARKHGQPPLSDVEKHDAYMGRKVRGRVTGTPSKSTIIGKMMKKDVLYLVVVDLPTQEQLDSMRLQLESSKE